MRHRTALLCLAPLLALTTPDARAQPRPPAAPPPGAPAVVEPPVRGQIGAQIRRRATERLLEVLRLDPAAAARLTELVERYDARLAPYRRELRRGRRQLVAYTRSGGGDDAILNQVVDSVLTNQASVRAIEDERLREARRALAPRQFAQLVVALPLVKLEIQREIGRALRSAAPGDDGPDDE